jgi:hypothetical protein
MTFLEYIKYTKKQLALVVVGFVLAVSGSILADQYGFYGWCVTAIGLGVFYPGVKGSKWK